MHDAANLSNDILTDGATSPSEPCRPRAESPATEAPRDLALLRQWAAWALGTRSSVALIAEARCALIDEALVRSSGNLTRAARLLGITRQAVQQFSEQRRARR
jgi:hypothetical protein